MPLLYPTLNPNPHPNPIQARLPAAELAVHITELLAVLADKDAGVRTYKSVVSGTW